MEHGGFLDTRKPQPLTLGLIIAGHVAVLTALILAPGEKIIPITWLPTHVFLVPEKPTPPEVRPQPQFPKTQNARPIDNPAKPDVIVPTKGPEVIQISTEPPLIGRGGTAGPLNPPTFEPVKTVATMDPSAAGRFQPDYPLSLIRAGIEGAATVRVLIGTDGRVKQVEMVSATDPAFFDATRKQALRYWRFRPATTDGTPTESWRVMTVKFHLES